MARRSIEDVMNEIEDFLNSCKTTALSSNKVVVPRDEFDELFGDLKVKIPAEIDRCKKIMRNKDAILMDARKAADGILAEATAKAEQMVSETEIMALANQRAYETVEMARVQANDILAQASAEANELRLGSMQYTSDMMMGIRSYVQATLEAEQANYENLITALNNDFMIADANLNEIQNQIVDFTGNPDSVTKAPQMRTAAKKTEARTDAKTEQPKVRSTVAQRVKQAVTAKEKEAAKKEETAPQVNIPDFITGGESSAASEPGAKTSVKPAGAKTAPSGQPGMKAAPTGQSGTKTATGEKPEAANQTGAKTAAGMARQADAEMTATAEKTGNTSVEKASAGAGEPRKVTKKVVRKRNPVLHTPQTAQETVAKTLEAAAAVKGDKTVYKANGEQAREVPSQEGRVKRGPRVGRGMVEENAAAPAEMEITEQEFDTVPNTPGKSMGVIDDFSMEDKI